MSLRIERSIDPSSSEIERVRSGLASYNRLHIPDKGYAPIVLSLFDDANTFCGGLTAYVSYGWLFVDLLWVAEQNRSQGWGRALLLAAEEEARIRHCLHAWLDTFSFQARRFYEKLGYSIFAELEDFPPGHRRYFMRKRL